MPLSSNEPLSLTTKPAPSPHGRPQAAARTRLRFYSHLDTRDPKVAAWIGSRNSLQPKDAAAFPGDTLAHALARALCERGALPVKELFEATETFELVRKNVRRPSMADLCCGHGLGGLLFAVFEREVEDVLLVDRERPASANTLLDLLEDVAPWAPPKVRWEARALKRVELRPDTGVIAIHACGLRTDTSLQMAVDAGGPFAALPCCRPHRLHPAPQSLKNALGADVAIDVHRTYELERAGYTARWQEIAEEITPMNRVLSGYPART